MSNLNQLVKELADLEQRRDKLESDIAHIEDILNDSDESDDGYDKHASDLENLNEQLDHVYGQIDAVEAELDDTNNEYYEEDY